MKAKSESMRITIAVSESSPVQQLWRAALRFLSDSPAELTALFVADDRWHRAASLPFTCEISRIGGAVADFTVHRAEQVSTEAVTRAQRRMEDLASEAGLALAFEVLSESDQERIRELVAGARNVLIAPSFMTSRPIFAQLKELDCRIVLIETPDKDRERA
jgi:hypothetical protein